MRLLFVETVEVSLGAIKNHLIIVEIIKQQPEIHEEPAALTGVLQEKVGSNERIDERREPLLPIEDKPLGARCCRHRPGSSKAFRRKWRILRVAAKQEKGTDVVAAKNRPQEIRDLVSTPYEVALEGRQAKTPLIRLLNQADELPLVWDDFFHGLSCSAGCSSSRIQVSKE